MSLPLGDAWSISDAATEESAPLTVDEEGKPFLISYEVSVVSFLVSTPGIDKMLNSKFSNLFSCIGGRLGVVLFRKHCV